MSCKLKRLPALLEGKQAHSIIDPSQHFKIELGWFSTYSFFRIIYALYLAALAAFFSETVFVSLL